ncbi:hypothetical protein GCM10011316_21550 [Roseibium aquae]|uniref:Uncharacterized protein n=1 Tax=Roseibium aquae TaxID=1323746 RepID=A0A916TJT4_9HYPH|nr:hypothetical protein GCM10011316_21550 [Roseibium aquae]
MPGAWNLETGSSEQERSSDRVRTEQTQRTIIANSLEPRRNSEFFDDARSPKKQGVSDYVNM